MKPYYDDGQVQLWHGDARVIHAWLQADVVVTDPPYGTKPTHGYTRGLNRVTDRRQQGKRDTVRHTIEGDEDTSTRDTVLDLMSSRHLAVVFGSALQPAPNNAVQFGAYLKPPDAGAIGSRGGWRRDLELFYLVGNWPMGAPIRSGLITTMAPLVGSSNGVGARAGHPHAKPLDVMEKIIDALPKDVVIADPFAGSGSTLVAARNLGRRAIGVELEERYCRTAAARLRQSAIDFEGLA